MRPVAAATGFLACIIAANYVTTEYGLIPVGFGLVATAGTYLAGLTFVLRDALQDAIRGGLPGRIVFIDDAPFRQEWAPPSDWSVAWRVGAIIVAGAALSYAVSDPFIALASGVAFLASEAADLAVYTPLRRRGYVRAAIASNVVGAVVDTFLFLWIAGFPIAGAWQGQIVGKVTVTALVVALVAAVRVRRAVAA
jgi:queuosine precursor transporter